MSHFEDNVHHELKKRCVYGHSHHNGHHPVTQPDPAQSRECPWHKAEIRSQTEVHQWMNEQEPPAGEKQSSKPARVGGKWRLLCLPLLRHHKPPAAAVAAAVAAPEPSSEENNVWVYQGKKGRGGEKVKPCPVNSSQTNNNSSSWGRSLLPCVGRRSSMPSWCDVVSTVTAPHQQEQVVSTTAGAGMGTTSGSKQPHSLCAACRRAATPRSDLHYLESSTAEAAAAAAVWRVGGGASPPAAAAATDLPALLAEIAAVPPLDPRLTPARTPVGLDPAATVPSPLVTFAEGGEVVLPHARPAEVHSQVEYQHHLIPNLKAIFDMPHYWGIMDRYQAEAVLDEKTEGTFLLRDSAQDDFIFSVSFRRFKRTLHARLELHGHRFTFDSHDPNIFSAESVGELLGHYRDPSNCMFYEPMCCAPLARPAVFSLQELCRSAICSATDYDGLGQLPLPRQLVKYLCYYHYKVPVRCSYFGAGES